MSRLIMEDGENIELNDADISTIENALSCLALQSMKDAKTMMEDSPGLSQALLQSAADYLRTLKKIQGG